MISGSFVQINHVTLLSQSNSRSLKVSESLGIKQIPCIMQ